MLIQLLYNPVLVSGLIAWGLAQMLKLPLAYLETRKWTWRLLFSPGGMPSSHSSLIIGTTLAIGLFYGFDTPFFALAVAISMIVVYDASGVRRQAGIQATVINDLIDELFPDQPVTRKHLKEVIGHSPIEVIGGILLGIATALVVWALW
jgi:acid phosphatase family membrane protein YuiD